MQRNLQVIIDESTWPGAGLQPSFPSTFLNGTSNYGLSIPGMLLMIGYLTTPTSATGVSLSEFWAWVRYLAAVAASRNLSVTQSFWELDAHQKTILSDDFGMGVPMLWLCEKLSFAQIVDGRYFMRRIASSLGATQARTAKRGPNKTPDFVAQDIHGNWHVIECKGTQSGTEYNLKQLGTKGPPATGGVAQKCSILFPSGSRGQRLVCGLTIDLEGGNGSVLKVIDPTADEPFVLEENQMDVAQDAANRGVMAKALRMAGIETAAESVASPFGDRPEDRRARTEKAEDARKKLMADRDKRSREEIQGIISRGRVFDADFRGRETVVQLPRAVRVGDISINQVVVKQGVNREALDEIEEKPSEEALADEKHGTKWVRLLGRSIVESHERSAILRIGSAFRLEVELVP